MEKFLEFLNSHCYYINYEIQDGAVIVQSVFKLIESDLEPDLERISIPENTDFTAGLDLEYYKGEIQLPENLTVAYQLDLTGTNTKRLPSNLTIYDDCSVYLDAHKIENVSYSDNCGRHDRTIFAFWANDDFLIAAGCFAGTYSEFEERVNKAYRDYKADAAEYKRKARGCIRRLAQKLGKPNPFKTATAN